MLIHQVLRQVFLGGERLSANVATSGLAIALLGLQLTHSSPHSDSRFIGSLETVPVLQPVVLWPVVGPPCRRGGATSSPAAFSLTASAASSAFSTAISSILSATAP